MNFEDGAETELVKALEETDAITAGNPGLQVVKECGKNHSPVIPELYHVHQVFVAPSTCVQSAK